MIRVFVFQVDWDPVYVLQACVGVKVDFCFWVAPLTAHLSSCRRQSDETGVWLLEYCAAENKLDRFWRSLEKIKQIRIRFLSLRKFVVLMIRIFRVFGVQLHAMRLYMCKCCGLCAPTQFHFECCRVSDDS